MLMDSEGNASRFRRGLVLVLLFAFSLVSAFAIVGDYVGLGFVANGITLTGHDVSGMDRSQLQAAIETDVSTPLMRPLTVRDGTTSWAIDPKTAVTVDANAMIDSAYAPQRNAGLVARLVKRVTGTPYHTDVKPICSVDRSVLSAWVAQTATSVDRSPVDATRTVSNYLLHIAPAVYGATVDQTRAVDVVSQALTDEASLAAASRVVSLPVDLVAPRVLESSFKMAIVVSIRDSIVRLYDGATLVKIYRCAPGQPAYPTPTGNFVIVRKQANAPWINPHDAWSASMPDVIPGGPGNPMGDRKIAINYPGVFLHGIPPGEYGSIGTHASHGCMRMMPSAIHDLYPRVKVGDPVFIRE
jgi:lipoprotein-anchoring transpeptidase ErfK/SrfK